MAELAHIVNRETKSSFQSARNSDIVPSLRIDEKKIGYARWCSLLYMHELETCTQSHPILQLASQSRKSRSGAVRPPGQVRALFPLHVAACSLFTRSASSLLRLLKYSFHPVLTAQEPNIYTALSHAAMSLPPLSNTETLLPNFPAERPLLPARNASDGETDYSTDDNLSSTGSDGWVDFGRGDLYEDICDDDDDNNNNKNNDDNKNHTTYVKIKSKTGASSRVKPPIVSAKHLSSRSRAKHRDSTTDHRDFIVCFMMIIVILALLLPERTFIFCELVGFVLAEVASILIEAKILRFVLAVVLFTVASLKKQNP